MTTLAKTKRDPNTLSNYDKFITTHLQANLNIDFTKRLLAGNVALSLKSASDASSNEIILDTSYLDIEDVKINQKSCDWELHSRIEPFGSPLRIKLDEAVDHGEALDVDVGSDQGL